MLEHNRNVSFKLPPSLYDYIKRYSKQTGVSMSDYIRDSLQSKQRGSKIPNEEVLLGLRIEMSDKFDISYVLMKHLMIETSILKKLTSDLLLATKIFPNADALQTRIKELRAISVDDINKNVFEKIRKFQKERNG